MALGFEERTRGGHHIYTMQALSEVIILQPQGSDAKVYQVRQMRTLFIQHELYKLLEDE